MSTMMMNEEYKHRYMIDSYFNRVLQLKEYKSGLDACMPEIFSALRERQGWTQRECAEWLGCTNTAISKIEQGHMIPGKPLLSKLLEVLEREREE